MTISFFWIRHGPTNVYGLNGWTDVAVDLTDIKSLNWLHDSLPQDALVIASDLQRASQTADAIQRARTRLPDEKGLRELHFGDWEGKTPQEVAEIDKVLSIEFWEKPGDIKAPGGESWNDLCLRVNQVVDNLARNYPDTNIVIVAHYAVILTQIQKVLGVPSLQVMHRKINNLSLTKITRRKKNMELEFSNKLASD